MTEKKFVSTRDIEHALAQRYAAPEYTFLTQVRNGTGFQRITRTADALAISMYPSRGITITGFEIKASIADWRKELKDPDKAEAIEQHCHHWFVAAPYGMIDVNEVPRTWGLIEVKTDGSIRVKKTAMLREMPVPMNEYLFASIVRNIGKTMVPANSVEPLIRKARAEGIEAGTEIAGRELKRLRSLETKANEFEQKSGVSMNAWDLGDIADLVSVMRETGGKGHMGFAGLLKRHLSVIASVKDSLERAIENVESIGENTDREDPELHTVDGAAKEGT